MKFARSLLFACWLYGLLTVLGFWFLPYTLIDGPKGAAMAHRAWTRATLWGLGWMVGARVVIEGRENLVKGPAIYAAKHQAMLDVMAPSLFLDNAAYVYKIELQKELMLGWFLGLAKMIPVARETQATALKAMLRAARTARDDGRPIFIFPEGTRQQLDAPPAYKPGVAAIYRDLGVPCVPIALNTGLVWKPKGIMRSPGVVTFKILPAIAPGLSRNEFMHELETRIETESQALLPPQLRRSVAA